MFIYFMLYVSDMSGKRVVVLASGEGTNFQALIDAVAAGSLEARIVALIADKKSCGALRRARESGVEAVPFPRTEKNRETYFRELDRKISSFSPDLIVTAGFMKILPSWLVERYHFKIINTHPSLLPCFGGPGFYGNRVHEKVIESGARITGCTVHFVIPDVDAGPIVAQRPVDVMDTDTPETLSERIKEVEHGLLVEAVSVVLSGRYEVSGKRVRRN